MNHPEFQLACNGVFSLYQLSLSPRFELKNLLQITWRDVSRLE